MDIQQLAKMLANKKDLTINETWEYMDMYGFSNIEGAYKQLSHFINEYSSRRKGR